MRTTARAPAVFGPSRRAAGPTDGTLVAVSTTVTFTAVAVRDLPYPPGLGKMKHGAMDEAMKVVLSGAWSDIDANRRLFWTPAYQGVIRKFLDPAFDNAAIEDVARRALELAKTSPLFGTPQDEGQFAQSLPPRPQPSCEDHLEYLAAEWLWSPPMLFCGQGDRTIDDGRHRLSYLRSRVEPLDPMFPVLVRLWTP